MPALLVKQNFLNDYTSEIRTKAKKDLTDHICQNGLKVCSDVCFFALRLSAYVIESALIFFY